MNRSIVYSLEQIRAFDTLWGWRDTLYGLAGLSQNMLGNAVTGVLTSFVGTQTSSPSLVINVSQGWIYQLAPVDATVYGALGADSTAVMQQGFAPAGTLTFTTAGLTSGQGQWALVQVSFGQTDIIRAGDPNAGILPYINVANPNVPFQGPNNSNTPQNTERQGVAVFDIKYGAPATSGMEIPPSPDSGNLPLFLVDLTFGQSTISTGQILLAGPAAYTGTGFPSGYPNSPYFPGVLGTTPGASAGSHHGGIAGQANKINLTAGAEVTGVAAYGNLPVSNTAPNAIGVGGVVTVAQDIPVSGQTSGNPNGLVPGMQNDQLFDTVTQVLYVCTVAGNAGAAVWVGVGSGGISSYQNANFSVTGGNFTYLGDTAGGSIIAQLPTAVSMGGTAASFINIGSNLLTITPNSGESINGLTVGTSIVLLPGSGITLSPRTGTGWYTLNPQLQYNIITKSSSFTASDPSGSFYVMTAACTVTLQAATGSGKIRTFRMAPSAGLTVGAIFLTNGSDTIANGGDICGPSTTNQFFIPDYTSGPFDLIDYAPGQWTVK